jgi:hypothetical protein
MIIRADLPINDIPSRSLPHMSGRLGIRHIISTATCRLTSSNSASDGQRQIIRYILAAQPCQENPEWRYLSALLLLTCEITNCNLSTKPSYPSLLSPPCYGWQWRQVQQLPRSLIAYQIFTYRFLLTNGGGAAPQTPELSSSQGASPQLIPSSASTAATTPNPILPVVL